VLLTLAAVPARVSIRRIGPDDAAALNALAERDNLFDEDPATEPSGALTSDGARDFLADPSVLFWLAEAGGQVVGFLHCYVQRRRTAGPVSTANAVSLPMKAKSWSRSFIDWTPHSGLVRV
jgi:hypothetical protein